MLVLCPGCSTQLQIDAQHLGQALQCPLCSQQFIAPQPPPPIADAPSTWRYMKEGWFGDENVGPIGDEQFIDLVRRRKIKPETLVLSPEFTRSQWLNLSQLDLRPVEARILQRHDARRRQEEEKLEHERIRKENFDRLRNLVVQVVSDGVITPDEHGLIAQFAAQIPTDEATVRRMIELEGSNLLSTILQESLQDGVFTPDEEERLTQTAANLNIPLTFEDQTADAIELAKLSWLFNSCELDEFPTISTPFPLQSKEACHGSLSVEWNNISRATRQGMTTYCLNPIGAGTVYVTNSRLVFITDLDSKTVRHTSVGKVERYSNGTLVVRTSGQSVFLRFTSNAADNHKISLLMQRVCLGDSVQVAGFFPQNEFDVPNATPAAPNAEVLVTDVIPDEPRYTFRVVGDHFDDRQAVIWELALGDPVQLVREPGNPHDRNAVQVCDRRGRMFGYLKREVAEWFAPKIDYGARYRSEVYRMRNDRGVIVGVYEA